MRKAGDLACSPPLRAHLRFKEAGGASAHLPLVAACARASRGRWPCATAAMGARSCARGLYLLLLSILMQIGAYYCLATVSLLTSTITDSCACGTAGAQRQWQLPVQPPPLLLLHFCCSSFVPVPLLLPRLPLLPPLLLPLPPLPVRPPPPAATSLASLITCRPCPLSPQAARRCCHTRKGAADWLATRRRRRGASRRRTTSSTLRSVVIRVRAPTRRGRGASTGSNLFA